MKKLITSIAAILTAAGIATVAAPTAAATPAENTMFLQALVNQGWQVWDVSGMIRDGETVCGDINTISGWTGADEERWLFNNRGYNWNDSVALVTAAVYNICPEFLPGGWANPRGSLSL